MFCLSNFDCAELKRDWHLFGRLWPPKFQVMTCDSVSFWQLPWLNIKRYLKLFLNKLGRNPATILSSWLFFLTIQWQIMLSNIPMDKTSFDGVFRIRTCGSRMEGEDDSTELWALIRHFKTLRCTISLRGSNTPIWRYLMKIVFEETSLGDQLHQKQFIFAELKNWSTA